MSFLSPRAPDTMPDMAELFLRASLTDQDDHFYAVANALLRDMRSACRTIRGLRHGIAGAIASMRKLTDRGLDEAIEATLRHEMLIADLRGRGRQTMNRMVARSRHKGGTRQGLVRRLTGTLDQLFVEGLRYLRDTRSQLIAVRAQREPASDEPVISTIAEVDEFFRRFATA